MGLCDSDKDSDKGVSDKSSCVSDKFETFFVDRRRRKSSEASDSEENVDSSNTMTFAPRLLPLRVHGRSVSCRLSSLWFLCSTEAADAPP